MTTTPGGPGVGSARALPPRQGTALTVGDHEFEVQDALVSVAGAGQSSGALCGVVCARVVVTGKPACRVGWEQPVETVEAVGVGGIDHGQPGSADGGSEE